MSGNVLLVCILLIRPRILRSCHSMACSDAHHWILPRTFPFPNGCRWWRLVISCHTHLPPTYVCMIHVHTATQHICANDALQFVNHAGAKGVRRELIRTVPVSSLVATATTPWQSRGWLQGDNPRTYIPCVIFQRRPSVLTIQPQIHPSPPNIALQLRFSPTEAPPAAMERKRYV